MFTPKCMLCESENLNYLSEPVARLDMAGIYHASAQCRECRLASEVLIVKPEDWAAWKAKQGYRLEIELTGLPRRFNEGQGSHWTVRNRESQKWHKRLLGKMILSRLSPPPKPLKKAQIALIRCSSKAPDYDGLVQSMKPIVDALKKSLIIEDDSMGVIGKPNYEWERTEKNEGKIKIIVQEI